MLNHYPPTTNLANHRRLSNLVVKWASSQRKYSTIWLISCLSRLLSTAIRAHSIIGKRTPKTTRIKSRKNSSRASLTPNARDQSLGWTKWLTGLTSLTLEQLCTWAYSVSVSSKIRHPSNSTCLKINSTKLLFTVQLLISPSRRRWDSLNLTKKRKTNQKRSRRLWTLKAPT